VVNDSTRQNKKERPRKGTAKVSYTGEKADTTHRRHDDRVESTSRVEREPYLVRHCTYT